MGEMADDYDLYDDSNAYMDEMGRAYTTESYDNIRCKFCGKKRLHWKLIDKGWRLHNSKFELHLCKNRRIKIKKEK